MNNVLYIAAAFAIGICVSLQAPINSVMSRSLESPLLGSTVIDQLGLFGTPVKPDSTIKLLGLFMVLTGAILVQSSNA